MCGREDLFAKKLLWIKLLCLKKYANETFWAFDLMEVQLYASYCCLVIYTEGKSYNAVMDRHYTVVFFSHVIQ